MAQIFTFKHILLILLLICNGAPHNERNNTEELGLLSGDTSFVKTINVNGTFLCGNKQPYPHALVRLFSNKQYIKAKSFSISYIIDGTKAENDGSFVLNGEKNVDLNEKDVFSPVLAIYHQCGQLKRKNATYRRFLIKVPDKYVNSYKTFDVGKLNLELFYPGQTEGNVFYKNRKPLKIIGKLSCPGSKVFRKVRLYGSQKRDMETFLSEVTLQSDSFIIEAPYTDEFQPVLTIMHQCGLSSNEVLKGTYRQINIGVPYYYYNKGRIGLKPFDTGNYNLEVEYPGETKLIFDDE